jgi:hypothetical protein
MNLPEIISVRSVYFDAGSLVYCNPFSSLFMHQYTFFVVSVAFTLFSMLHGTQ